MSYLMITLVTCWLCQLVCQLQVILDDIGVSWCINCMSYLVTCWLCQLVCQLYVIHGDVSVVSVGVSPLHW